MSSESLTNASISDLEGALIRADEAGGEIILKGESVFGSGTLNVTKSVTIRGDLNAERPTINGGGGVANGKAFPAFEIIASGVTIEHLHFFRPQAIAIRAAAVNGAIIRDCRIEELQVPGGFAAGSAIIVGAMPPSRGAYGDLQVVDNVIDTVGSSSVGTVGILFNQAGIDTTKTAQVLVQGNEVTNVTGFGIDFRDLQGTAIVTNNTIERGATGADSVGFPSGIRGFGSSAVLCEGQYTINGNIVTCGIESSAGIRIYSNSAAATLTGAIVSANQINVSTPTGLSADRNAGIEIRGFVIDAEVSHNTITGEARAALSVTEDPKKSLDLPVLPGPNGTMLTENHHD